MAGAVATRSGPRTGGGNITQRQATGWKREKKKKKPLKKTELPPLPDLSTYQPVPLCTSLTRKRPALYMLHQVEQQLAQYAAEILVQQHQAHLDLPKQKKVPPQLDRKRQNPRATRGPQQRRRGQPQPQSPPKAEQEQYIQRQIHILFDQHGNAVKQHREHTAAESGAAGVAVSPREVAAAVITSQGQSNRLQAKEATFDGSLTFPRDSSTWDMNTTNKNPNGATWEGTPCPGSSRSIEASSLPQNINEMHSAFPQQQQQQNSVEAQEHTYQQESILQGAPASLSSAAGTSGTSGNSIYPNENFVMVVRRRPRDPKLATATEGAAAAPGRTNTTPKGNLLSRRKQKATARVLRRENKRPSRALSPPHFGKTTSTHSPHSEHFPPAPCISNGFSSVACPDATELQATYITQDERFVEMKNALSRYWKATERELHVHDLLNNALPMQACSSVEAAGRTTLQATPRATTLLKGEGTNSVQATQQRYFKVRIPQSHHTRVEARWIRKQVSTADGLEELPPVTAENYGCSSSGKYEMTAAHASANSSESAWNCLTGMESTVVAAETAQAITAAVSAKLDAPARQLQRQKAHTFFHHLATCLRELLSSRDSFFRLAYLDSVYRWFCARHPRVYKKAVHGPRHSSGAAVLPPFLSSTVAFAAHTLATPSSSLDSADVTSSSATSSATASGLNSALPVGDRRAADTVRTTRASAVPPGFDPSFSDELDHFFEESRLHTHEFPLLKEAAAFDARELSTCSGSAFFGCTYYRTKEKRHIPCEKYTSGTAGYFYSLGSTESTDHTSEDATLDNSSLDRFGRQGSVGFDKDNRNTTVARENYYNGKTRPTGNRSSCCTSGDVVLLKKKESFGIAATVAHYEELSDADRKLSALPSAESISAPTEKSFREIVQQRAPLITPMDRLREYKSRTLFNPAAAAAVYQHLQARLRSGAQTSEIYDRGPGRATAARAPTTSFTSTAARQRPSQTGARMEIFPSAEVENISLATTTPFASASATAPMATASPTTKGERNFLSRTAAANKQQSVVTPLLQQRPAASFRHQQSNCQQQHLGSPASTPRILMQVSTFQFATGQATTLQRTDSAEAALLIRDDLRNNYLGDWRVVQPPWGMQAAELPEAALAATSGTDKRASDPREKLQSVRTSISFGRKNRCPLITGLRISDR